MLLTSTAEYLVTFNLEENVNTTNGNVFFDINISTVKTQMVIGDLRHNENL